MKRSKTNIHDWLENLQQESWHLELLISGFSIFLLLQAVGSFDDILIYIEFHYNLDNAADLAIFSILGVTYFGTFALIINLVLHIILRGFWIGTIGLRSVQKTTDFDKLSYSALFTKKLKEKVESLDALSIKLDALCSTIFAFTFLIIFMFLSFGLSLSFIGLLEFAINGLANKFPEGSTINNILNVTYQVVVLTFLATGLVYLIDTVSLGFFKKYKFLSKIYYPIYWFFGIITMSGIYRAIYYNLISRFPKNKLRFILLLYLVALFMIPLSNFNQYQFFPDTPTDQNFYSTHYDNLRDKDQFISRASIPSNIINDQFLPVFIRYNVFHNDLLRKLCTDYTPSKTGIFQSGVKFSGGIQIGNANVKEESSEKLLKCLSSFYIISINDSTYTDQEFFFYQHPNKKELGLHTTIDIRHLDKGKNIIKIERKDEPKKDSIINIKYTQIPFWLQ